MKKIIFIYFCLFLTNQLYSQKIKWLEGCWEGEGYQPNSLIEQVWSMHLCYLVKEKKIVVEYPSLQCGGNWTLQKAEKNRAIFIENLSYGIENCMNESKLIVSYIDNDFITVAFYDVIYNKEEVIAICLLKRNG